jgi:uncharacterized phage protein (TIGR02220 family)
MTFTKLFSSITESTVWYECASTRLAWITMLAMADRNGRVWSSVPGLAGRARIPVEDARIALESFLAPDPDSRTPEFDGRRIEPIDGGWRLLNYFKYRDTRDARDVTEDARVRQQAKRARDRVSRDVTQCHAMSHSVTRGNGNAEAEAEEDIKKKQDTVGQTPPDVSPRLIVSKIAGPNLREQARKVLEFLNAKTGRNYQPVEANLDFIIGRLRDGASEDDLRSVIAKKTREWRGDEKMNQFLRPATLFNRTKFAQYCGELGQKEPTRA